MLGPAGRLVVARLLLAAAVIAVVSWVLVPIVVSGLYALAVPGDYYDQHKVLPTRFTLEHVRELLVLGARDAIVNSVIVAAGSVAISFALGLPAGYAFARYRFPGRDTLRLLLVGLRMFPIVVIAVPLVALYIRLGLSDTLLGLALAHASMSLPFVVLITASIFAGVPRDLEEAGLVFGLTPRQVFLRITLPLALPGLAAAGMFAFLMSWNEVFLATVLTLVNRTLPAFILTQAMAAPDFIKFAASLIMILPAVAFVAVARRYLVSMWGITLR